ncbi:MAG: zinc ribbon domain-containing protein, partial [Eggerthellaceae bacterium]|nr:zinc ribbon domain-containing protein [Eggerthellaceae bacterium]
MGFFDSVSATFNNATAATSRGAKLVKLKAQLGEVNKNRQSFAAQLGASLYDSTRSDPTFREGRES